MSKEIILSVDLEGHTCWEEGPARSEDQKIGGLALSGVEVYFSDSPQNAKKLSDQPESEELALALCEWVAESFPRMPKKTKGLKDKDLSLAPFVAPDLGPDPEQEWVFYGGSFNPWHQGHQACLDLMPQGPKLVVVPDRNPWKPKAEVLSWGEFWELALHIQKCGHSLYPGFFMMNTTNPTADWLALVEGKKSLLIGDDNLCQIQKWKNHETLLSCLTSLYVAPREVESQMDLKLEESLAYVRSFGVSVQRLGRHDYEHLSSTQIRAKKRPS